MEKFEQVLTEARRNVEDAYDLAKDRYQEYNMAAVLKALDKAEEELCKASIYVEVAHDS